MRCRRCDESRDGAHGFPRPRKGVLSSADPQKPQKANRRRPTMKTHDRSDQAKSRRQRRDEQGTSRCIQAKTRRVSSGSAGTAARTDWRASRPVCSRLRLTYLAALASRSCVSLAAGLTNSGRDQHGSRRCGERTLVLEQSRPVEGPLEYLDGHEHATRSDLGQRRLGRVFAALRLGPGRDRIDRLGRRRIEDLERSDGRRRAVRQTW